MSDNKIAAIAVAILGLIVLGCSGIDDLKDGSDPFENNGANVCLEDGPEMEGVWVLAGSGSRTGCQDKTLNTEHFELSSAPLKISATEDSFGNIQFELGQAITGFSLDGAVDCTDVMFTTTEMFRGEEINYTWVGESIGSGTITGTFSGSGPNDQSGPDTCQTTGQFRMVKR